MSEQMIREAFEQIGLAAGQAAQLPDHRERPRDPIVVEKRSTGGEVFVMINDGKVEGLTLDELWLQDEHASTVATLVQQTINEAYEEWSQKQLEDIMTVTPDMKELYGALGAARAKLGEAWAQGLAEVRS